MKNKLDQLKIQSDSLILEYKPLFFRVSIPSDKNHLEKLLNEQPSLFVHDEINGQIEELVKSQNPKIVFTPNQLSEAALKHLGETPSEEYGVWVYYPWSGRLVHILDEEEYTEVRTNRNQYKITPGEEQILSKKKIGVIGLSVGQSIALTIAMERICGELRLIDFDKLELSNLNRIRSGVHNLEIPKVVLVAREIAEIDPFLKTTCYIEGLSEENINDFFLLGGKLDVCIEVCDGLAMKILSRYKAKELRIPVVMNSSDKGTTDVERYDLNPTLPILHGLIDHLDLNKVKDAKTNEEKIPYLLPMLGVDTASERLKATMLEIEQSTTTWAQLASGVVMGGAICTDVCRRILLNQFHESGRYFIDLEELIQDKATKYEKKDESLLISSIPPLSFEQMKDIAGKLNLSKIKDQLEPTKEVIIDIINTATLAPSIGNNQPWKWLYIKGALILYHDKSRSVSFGDFQDIGSLMALGASIENTVLKTHALKLEVALEVFPLNDDKRVIAIIRFFNQLNNSKLIEPHIKDELVDFTGIRFTNRKICEIKKIDKIILDELKDITKTINGAELHILEDKQKLSKIGAIIGGADRLRFMQPQGHYDFFAKEARWNSEEFEKTKDGIDISTMGLSPSEYAGFKIASDYKIIKYLKDWKLGTGLEKISKKNVAAASAMGLITMPEYSSKNYINGGRAMQRMWLMATKNNISIQPLLGPIFYFSRLLHGKGEGMDPNMIKEVIQFREAFSEIFPIQSNNNEIFLFRLFIDDKPMNKSLRQSIEEVLAFR